MRPFDSEHPRPIIYPGEEPPDGEEPNFSSPWWEWRRRCVEIATIRLSAQLWDLRTQRAREKLAAKKAGKKIEQTEADRTLSMTIME